MDQSAWSDALVSEIRRYGAELGHRPLTSVFFGGGTPSLMYETTVAAVIDTATDVFAASNDLEISLEANPSSVEAGRFRGYRAAGVNRVSLGVQSLTDSDLKALGRLHSVAEARSAIEIAQSTFDRVSFDLIYARQNQSAAEWERELTDALTIGTDHLSLYQLTIEPGTAFGDRYDKGGLKGLPDENLSADLFSLTNALCDEVGLMGYEISNHARSGAECIHNMVYWRCGDFAGVGPGAHGRLTLGGQRWATEAHKDPGLWLRAAEAGTGETLREAVPPTAHGEEVVMMGLRTGEGIELARLAQLDVTINPGAIDRLVSDGWVAKADGRIKTTVKGRPVLNAILRELLV